MGAARAVDAQSAGDGHPAAIAGLSYRHHPRVGCRPAEESGKECDGGVTKILKGNGECQFIIKFVPFFEENKVCLKMANFYNKVCPLLQKKLQKAVFPT